MAARLPFARQVSWPAVGVQLAVLAACVGAASLVADGRWASTLGLSVYLAWSFGSRAVLAREHRAGIARVRAGDLAGALGHFERSFAFSERHRWADAYRAVVMLSASALSYREMALVNAAFCHTQLGDGAAAVALYERALRLFPESAMAATALRTAEAFRETSAR